MITRMARAVYFTFRLAKPVTVRQIPMWRRQAQTGTITLNALGTATVTASYQGFMAQTVVSSLPTIIGNLYGSIATNGAYQLNLFSSAGTTNIVQASTNLINWSTLATIYSTNGLIQLQDNATMQMRFYRVQQQ